MDEAGRNRLRIRVTALTAGLAAASAAALALPGAGDTRRTPDCLRGGARLEAAAEDVRVVVVRERRRGRATGFERVLGCWSPTGRRFLMLRREALGQDVDVSIRLEIDIVSGRYIGMVAKAISGVHEWQFARTWDARTRRRLHDADACPTADEAGVDQVAFGARGAMAYACNAVGLRMADVRGDRELEPPETVVRALAMSSSPPPRVYWTAVIGDREELRSNAVAIR